MTFKLRKLSKARTTSSKSNEDEGAKTEKNEPLSDSLAQNVEAVKQKTGNSADISIREITLNDQAHTKAAVVFVEGIVDQQAIDDFLIHSLINDDDLKKNPADNILETIAEKVVALGELTRVHNHSELFQALFNGETVVLIEGFSEGVSTDTKGGESRSVDEPPTEISLRGPREGFTESIRTNTSLVRRRIKNEKLWVKSITLGKVTNTDVEIMYIDGLAESDIVQEVENRLNRINTDSILESGYIEELIEDQTATTFPTIAHSERPDVVTGNLLEGKIAIFIDGTPFVLMVPAVFVQFFQSVDDYYSRFDIATSIRLLRIIIFITSLFAPAVYVAATTFHQEMIPTQLLIVLAAQREAAPLPAVVEAILMEIIFEVLREAGVRMPKAVGQTISIVGALVIGQAAVQAGIVSPAMVIVVAVTAIASFATPSYNIAIAARLIRFVNMIAAATFGFYGIILTFIVLLIHLCSLRSFGVPYMAPLAPFDASGAGDTIIRMPWWKVKKRPALTVDGNVMRQGDNQKPSPPTDRTMK
ncbi:spore germination protein KA [Alteribacillus persepolensis]|uniref:Spore germination protein KA n=1 Tax=Alteribacillus persepolensis TaxID=568899 RepID=A0A1G7Z207_9BACI|nr:spore germination protein [Alteribacillus persepolensis]SDH02822.1 spore germination protein KA [Alteribacillus persepolensis]